MGTCATCGADTENDNEECRDCGGGDTDTGNENGGDSEDESKEDDEENAA